MRACLLLCAMGVLTVAASCGSGGSSVPIDALDAPASCSLPSTEIDEAGTQSGDTSTGVGRGAGTCQSALGGGAALEVYYALTPTIDGEIVVSLDAAADLGVYVQRACGDAGSEVACADQQLGGVSERLVFPVEAGQLYYVVVDGFTTADVGPFTLTLTPRPTVGACASAPLFPASGPATGTTVGGANVFESACAGATTAEALYTYVVPGAATTSGTLVLTLASAADLGLAVRSTCTDSATELVCAEFAFAGGEETVSLPARGGSSLAIFVEGYQTGDEGPFTLTAAYVPSSCGDGFVTGLDEQCDPPAGATCTAACARPAGEWSCGDIFTDEDDDGDVDCLDSDCASSALCVPGAGAIGSACTASSQCAASSNDPVCFTELENGVGGGFCTERCSAADPCGDATAACTDIGIAEICADPCSPADPCGAGEICLDGVCQPYCQFDTDCPLTGHCDPLLPGVCTFPEVCDDGLDNNIDAYTDCGDRACIGDPACPPIAEVEPNDAVATANAYVFGAPFTGVLTMGDFDFVRVTATAGATIDVRTEDPAGGDRCFAPSIAGLPTLLEVIAPDGSTVASNDNASPVNLCSRTTIRNAVAGTYAVRVAATADAENEFIYRLVVTVTP